MALGTILIDLAAMLIAALTGVTGTWQTDLYGSNLAVYENPDYTACTAATAVMALNMAEAPAWTLTTSHTAVEEVLRWEQSHDTSPTNEGSDPHGLRNALNHFGWHDNGPYIDASWNASYEGAGAVVSAIARTGKPVVVFTQNGAHAQLVTGYETTGRNPRYSYDFQVVSIRLTDPLQQQGLGDARITLSQWKRGDIAIRWSPYWQTDSTLTDSDGKVGAREWRGQFVAVIPIW